MRVEFKQRLAVAHLRWQDSRCLCAQVGVGGGGGGGARQIRRPGPSPVSNTCACRIHTCAQPARPLHTYTVILPLEPESLCLLKAD